MSRPAQQLGESALTAFDEVGRDVRGEFVTIDGERYYAIRNVDRMAPFFISVVSNDNHWLFVSSTGGLTAGRVSPETALFPYVTDDKIHDSPLHTGCKTMVRVDAEGKARYWEPFNREHDGLYRVSRHIYKSALGNKLCFEEINHDLELVYRYTWATSDSFGFVRHSELQNLGSASVSAELVDGLQNLLPAGTPAVAQTSTSNLVNAYKWTELDPETGLAYLTLYSGITDRAEPCESLRASTVFALGLKDHHVLLSAEQLHDFRTGGSPKQEKTCRGVRGAYLISTQVQLAPDQAAQWDIVADIEQSQGDVVTLRNRLADPAALREAIAQSVEAGSDALARIMASADGFQVTAGENESVHHFANVLFNVMRGGNFHDQYHVSSQDFSATIEHFNKAVSERNRAFLAGLPERIHLRDLLRAVGKQNDPQLERLAREYLPLTFGRRHGDPSRPWNHFEIKIKDDRGAELLSYQGNWRDIFQNWEALTFSYPGFIESVIAKFVNASTVDGYNPYRIGKDGIDWEVEEPEDPWSYIGYWGDHQIIYLEKLLEWSRAFNPSGLHDLLRRPIFCYANVPYRIKPFSDLLEDPKSTVLFDTELADEIEQRVAGMGADGKLVLDAEGQVYHVNLLEKLLVPLLSKLSNLVIDGGIWLNTQRPEWNDANNALVGNGLSMVTLYYMRRYVDFLQDILAAEDESFALSNEVDTWFDDTAAALRDIRALLDKGAVNEQQRYEALARLGTAATSYRAKVYGQGAFSATAAREAGSIKAMLDDAQAVIDKSIAVNRRDDGLYHAYNLLNAAENSVNVDHLYAMLEGQVAALSAGTIKPDEVISVLDALFASAMYREDQHSFILYPDRELPGFLEKNRVAAERATAIPLLKQMLADDDDRVVYADADGWCRFNPDVTNTGELRDRLASLEDMAAELVDAAREPVLDLYEETFDHRAFTGRSGTMFGYEGLGSIYWHMVSKLLLAVQENYFAAVAADTGDDTVARLGELYYRVREGLGFNKTPTEYGAFPTDPYSHTPKHVGASQPGMTGQVKEEVLSRFGELGVRISDATVHFQPALLRAEEFLEEAGTFRYLDVAGNWHELAVPARGLAFTWCQVPVVYQLADDMDATINVQLDDGSEQQLADLTLTPELSDELFRRSGRVRQVTVSFGSNALAAL